MSTRATSVSGELEDREGSEHGLEEGGSVVNYSGCVYHLGVNSIGHEYCHLRFLLLRGSHVAMYKRDPHRNPGIKPIRKGVISHTLMVEDLGRRTINQGDVYVLRFYNRLDETKKGEIACASAGEARKWMEAFDQAKQKAVYELLKKGSRYMLDTDNELNLEGHRPRVRRYAHGLKNFIKIGRGPEVLLRKSSNLAGDARTEAYSEEMVGDAIEAHTWKCVRTVNGIRIFEDIAHPKAGKTFLVKAVGVIYASVDTVFETVLSIDRKKRYEWDMITGDLEFVDTIDGHYDVVYGTHEPQRLSWWQSKTDFVFSRQWFRGQDEAYTILQSPAVHRKRPPRSSYQRIKINPSTWEIRRLSTSQLGTAKCLVTQMLEIQCSFWDRWKRAHCLEFERTVPYALLCQVAGLKEYFESNPALILDSPSEIVHSNVADSSGVNSELEDTDVEEEFYDAIANDGSREDEESDDDDDDDFNFENSKSEKVKLKNVSWAITSLALKRRTASSENDELDCSSSPVTVDLEQFNGSLHKEKDESDTNCWAAPGGQGFMIRGKTYLSDYSKIMGGNPLLTLIAVDWLKASNVINQVALHPKCIVQSEAGKKLPFILVINLQVPAKPNYSLVLYYTAQRPVKKDSLLGRFANGSDVFRDARFKLIPSIVEGYWMVKRAVGTKACLLGKAVTCRYLRQDNFLEIDVDIGSSSVARSIINLVLGYVTSLVVDLAILIEAKEEKELPEYILGTVRLKRIKPDSALPF